MCRVSKAIICIFLGRDTYIYRCGKLVDSCESSQQKVTELSGFCFLRKDHLHLIKAFNICKLLVKSS